MFICKASLRTIVFLLGVVCALAACDRDSVFEPSEGVVVAPPDAGLFLAGNLKVMTRNLFVGAPVEMIYEPGVNIPQAAEALWGWVQSTKFDEERADAIADEIDDARPQVIGLQEVSVFTIYRGISPIPPFYCPPPSTSGPPMETLDFRDVLDQKLLARSLDYDKASEQANFSGAVPMCDAASPTGWSWITLADFDVILVQHGVGWDNAQADTFETNLEVELAGMPLEIYRGWASVDVTVEDFPFRFVTTHLEPRHPDPSIQVEQSQELIGILTNWTFPGGQLPTIVTGDINSAPTDPGGFRPYRNFIKAGFKDVVGPIRAEATCCQDETLLESSQLDRRVDMILFYGDFGRFPMFATITGNTEADRTPSGLWPSDHAGVVAWRRVPPPFASP